MRRGRGERGRGRNKTEEGESEAFGWEGMKGTGKKREGGEAEES